MRSAFHHLSSDRPGALLRRRTTALVLVVAAHVLLVIMLLRLAPPPAPAGPAVTTFELIPDPEARTEAAEEPEPVTKQPERRTPTPTPPVPPPAEVPPELDIIRLTPAEYSASDIAKLPSRPREAASAASESASAEVVGTGPNGERLYRAEWYREPTQAELAYYLPNGGPSNGWAMIACQTVADYRVDNCVELGQSHAGSGLASAIREAAWQFRVRPPRIGGRPLVGAWVSIRIDFTPDPAS